MRVPIRWLPLSRSPLWVLLSWPLLSCLLLAGAAVAGESLTAGELLRRLGSEQSPQVLDVRTTEEFAQGHVPGATLIPHDQLAARLDELDPTRPVVVYCRSGRRAGIAETLLRERGFDVAQLQGSWLAWQSEGRPKACPDDGCRTSAHEAVKR